MTSWYVQRESADLGPLRPAELLSLVRDGSVQPETFLRKDDSAWFAASEVGGLFEAARRPTIEYYCPHCENVRLAAPPATCSKCDRIISKPRQKITEHSIGNMRSDESDSACSRRPALSARRWLQKRMGKDKPS